MKKRLLIIGATIILLLGIYKGIEFQQHGKKHYEETKEEIEFLQEQIKDQNKVIDELIKQNEGLIKQLETIQQKQSEIKKSVSQKETDDFSVYTITFYTNSIEEGTNGITASGKRTREGRTVACDTNVLPLGTKVYIEGFGVRICEDTGSAIKGEIIDIFVEDKQKALDLGRQKRRVKVLSRN